MSQQEPSFYNLEFFGDAAFWEGAGDVTRRAFLMPLSNPAEFVAFGVFGTSDTVHFVARGRVGEHLGDFLKRMEEAGASATLYARVPLPWPLVKRYTSDKPYENHETEGPEGSSNEGLTYGGGAEPGYKFTSTNISQDPIWPANADSSTRKVFVLPLSEPDGLKFLALGVCYRSVTPEGYLFVFEAKGSAGAQRTDFINRMQQAGVSVEECTWPSLVFLQTHLDKNYQGQFIDPATTSLRTDTKQAA
jgi:hypothetical protein